MIKSLEIREIRKDEYEYLGKLMVDVYSKLEGFPTPEEQPGYYDKLFKIGDLNEQEDTQVLIAVSYEGKIVGGVVYFSNMSQYGSGGTATTERNASGIRLLGVDPEYRRSGIGKALAKACIRMAVDRGHPQVILHTTQAMQIAWKLYQKLGFKRSEDLDFMQEDLPVFGFRLFLKQP